MRFCPRCQSVLSKTTAATAGTGIVFLCRVCLMDPPGGPDDTLMAEGHIEMEERIDKHSAFIEQSPFDPAANIVFKECPQCRLDYMTMVRVGDSAITVYTCTCGYRATHSEYQM